MELNSNNLDISAWSKLEYDSDAERDPKKCEKLHWNPENTMKLIKSLERECKELWDTTHPLNKVKRARQLKVEYLANIFATSPEEISRKIHNLRTQFNNELRKIKRKSGSPEASGWEYFEALAFLRPTPADPLETAEAVNTELADFQTNEELQVSSATESPNAIRPSISHIPSSYYDSRIPPPMSPVWRKQYEPRIHTAPAPDECQIFGDFVASELRLLRSMDSRKKLKRIIQRAIIQMGEEDDQA
ncbi:uncharacterized protein LOC125053120 [Pieris napi]|uniref:uncharacterized protein LOC125053120 n=1 Tax=Pieris napi TaxID=78633 RepID=UPI001FBACB3E|nr:uncharacterized protein LOC125053120 [Pieris napi]